MEQVNSMILEMMQAIVQRPAAVQKPSQNDGTESDSFEKLMQQHRQPQDTGKTENTTQSGDREKPVVPTDESDAPAQVVDQEQMLWAAIAMMQNPVVPAEQTQLVPETVQVGTPIAAVNQPATAAVETMVPSQEQTAAAEVVMPQQSAMPAEQAQTGTEAPVGLEQAAMPERAAAPVQQQAETPADKQETTAESELPKAEVKVENNAAAEQPQTLFRDVEAVPVKVAEAPAAQQPAETKSVAEQLDGKLEKALAQGETRVEVRLEPESLGSVTIELTHSADGNLHVVLSAESVQTRELLERHAPSLQGLLAGRTPEQQVQVEVQRQQQSQGQLSDQGGARQGYQQQEQKHQRQPAHTQDFFQQLRLGLIPLEDIAS